MSSKFCAGCCLAIVSGWLTNVHPAACAEQKTAGQPHRIAKMEVSRVVDGNNRFAFDLYQRLDSAEGNLFFSPASLSTALAMTYAGAAGDTAAEMAKVLHFELPRPQINEAMKDLQAAWNANAAKQGYRLLVANRLWAQENFHFLPEFLAVTRNDYGAELSRLDMAGNPEAARQVINTWVLDQTQKKITDLIPSAAALANARLVLTNAIYFKGAWTDPFNKNLTKDDDFHVTASRTVKAPLMHVRHRFRYAAADGLQILELPYGDRNLSLVALLPDKVAGLPELERKLTSDNVRGWIDSMTAQEVIVFLPRFKTTTQFEMSGLLRSMGMRSAFEASSADFSGMTGSRDLFVSAVIHKAYVDVNEEGTEAAAATGIVMRATAVRVERPMPPPVFRADHPFVFLIRDSRNGEILFLGRVVEPSPAAAAP